MVRVRGVVLTGLLLVGAYGRAAAQEAGLGDPAVAPAQEAARPAHEGYEGLVNRAVKEFELGNFAEARAAFQEAHALAPNARTLRGLGLVEFELRNYDASIDLLEHALASDVRPLDERLRAETEQVLRTARSYVGHIELHIRPRQAHVTLDGEPVILGRDRTLRLVVGDHVLEVRAAGYLDQRRRVKVTGGGIQTLGIELVQLPAPRPDPASPVYTKWWFWTAAGAVVAGLVVGTVVLTSGDEQAAPSQVEGAVQVMALGGR